jgi:hypothetical protein
MPQWEYRKINLNDVPRKTEDIDLLNDAGHDGWDLVAITSNSIAYLKRPFEDSASPQEAQAPARTTRRKASTSPK